MYDIQLKPRAVKDLRNLPKLEALRVGEKLKLLEQGLSGEVISVVANCLWERRPRSDGASSRGVVGAAHKRRALARRLSSSIAAACVAARAPLPKRASGPAEVWR